MSDLIVLGIAKGLWIQFFKGTVHKIVVPACTCMQFDVISKPSRY